MPITRQDIEKLIEMAVDTYNDQALWCAKDAEGNFVVIDGIIQMEVEEFDLETNSLKFKGQYEPWKEMKPEEIFVYCYCYNPEGESIDGLSYEEWYIEFLSETSICLRDTKIKNDKSQFYLMPLDRIDKLCLGT